MRGTTETFVNDVPLMSNKGNKWEFRTPDLKSSSDMNDGVSRVPGTLLSSSSSSMSSPRFCFFKLNV